MLLSVLAIAGGAVCGALLRWLASSALNPILPSLPLGTLFVNLAGALIMGIASGFFAFSPDTPAQWKLLVITGFLGSLTTFSAFSAEMAAMISQQRFFLCGLAISLHVGGSIIMVFAGLWLFALIKRLFV